MQWMNRLNNAKTILKTIAKDLTGDKGNQFFFYYFHASFKVERIKSKKKKVAIVSCLHRKDVNGAFKRKKLDRIIQIHRLRQAWINRIFSKIVGCIRLMREYTVRYADSLRCLILCKSLADTVEPINQNTIWLSIIDIVIYLWSGWNSLKSNFMDGLNCFLVYLQLLFSWSHIFL